jgi:RNA polymerase sigma-70 factor (ECF subfamily)
LLEPADAEHADPQEHRAIEAALRALPAEQREVVHLKIYDGMTFQAIADRLEIPLNTAASRYRYAIDKLRELLATIGP